jgi:hypothetical protein
MVAAVDSRTMVERATASRTAVMVAAINTEAEASTLSNQITRRQTTSINRVISPPTPIGPIPIVSFFF